MGAMNEFETILRDVLSEIVGEDWECLNENQKAVVLSVLLNQWRKPGNPYLTHGGMKAMVWAFIIHITVHGRTLEEVTRDYISMYN